MEGINEHSGSPCIILNREGIFVDIITDGDIRRSILRGSELESKISELINYKFDKMNHTPIVVHTGTSDRELRSLMKKYRVRHIPVLDKCQRFCSLAHQEEIEEGSKSYYALIMAGGIGSRLRPLTDNTPKPMLPVKGKPLLERTIERLSLQGITEIFIATFYKSEKIMSHFSDGGDFGVSITYLNEKHLTGTAGALFQLPHIDSPILILNGDIYSNVNWKQMIRFHTEQNADLTVGAWQFEYQIQYGVIETEGYDVIAIDEKPLLKYSVNTGMYVLSPSCFKLLPEQVDHSQLFHMTNLLESAIKNDLRVVTFPVYERWIDIGNMQDYEKAQTSDII